MERLIQKAWAFLALAMMVAMPAAAQTTVAHQWNEQLLEAIRNDFARPTVHARNLYHSSILMYDCWAAYDTTQSETVFLGKTYDGFLCAFEQDSLEVPSDLEDRQEAQEVAMTYATYRLIRHRYVDSPQAESTMDNIYAQMVFQELDTSFNSTDYATYGAPALGNYLAEQLIAYGMTDGSNEANDYANLCYEQVEPNILPEVPGTSGQEDPQPLASRGAQLRDRSERGALDGNPAVPGARVGQRGWVCTSRLQLDRPGTRRLHLPSLEQPRTTRVLGHHAIRGV